MKLQQETVHDTLLMIIATAKVGAIRGTGTLSGNYRGDRDDGLTYNADATRRRTALVSFLLLILNKYDIVCWDSLQDTRTFLNHLEDLVADVALDDDLVLALVVLCHGRTRGKLLRKLLSGFLQVHTCMGNIAHGHDERTISRT